MREGEPHFDEEIPKESPDIERLSDKEKNEKPKLLYRAFTIDPEDLTLDAMTKPLVPGRKNKNDPTKIHDGNELGVYMSTNRLMVETAYAGTPKGLSIKSPKYHDGYNVRENIPLPQCGVVVEVDTENLSIRKPQIAEVFKSHYNNGWQGDEWIVDEVPGNQYKVVRLIISQANESKKFIVDINGPKKEDMEQAIEQIRVELERRKRVANEYRDFLEDTDEKVRMSSLALKNRWEKLKAKNKK